MLIPRWETEVWAEKLGGLAGDFLIGEREGKGSGNEGQHGDGDAGPEKGSKAMRSVRVVDLCTGTGCVALGVYEMLSRRLRRMGSKREVGRYDRGNRWYNVNVTGIDISTTALDLARRNLRHNISLGHLAKEAGGDISFIRADVLLASSSSSTMSPSDDNQQQKIPYLLNTLKAQYSSPKQKVKLDILTANPPYISPFHFSPGPSGRTTRSVRKYEPSLALVPGQSIKAPTHIWPKDTTPTPGDEFYYHILPLTFTLDVGVTVLEVGDTEQAHRVVQLARMMASMVGDPEALLELWFDDARTEVWGAEDGVINAGKETTRNMIHEANPDDTSNLGQVDRVSARAVVIWRREWAKWRKRCSSDW